MGNPILVTGAGGCIGAWTVKLLRDAGDAVVGFDLSAERRRLELLCDDPAEAQAVPWEVGDIADFDRVAEVFARHRPRAVIHLAALQVPFCKADPVQGARVNGVGGINVFEAARQAGNGDCARIAYASSVAATAMRDGGDGDGGNGGDGGNDGDGEKPAWLETLYGASKVYNEQNARVYWQDWQVPSVGIRPSVVYGPARDQGMSSKPTVAMLAAVLGARFVIPFTGPVGFVHASEAAAAFIQAVSTAQSGAHVFALNGAVKTVEEVVAMIRARRADAQVSCDGPQLPFPAAELSDEPLRAHIGDYARPTFEAGLDQTLELFARRVAEGRLSVADLG